MDDFLERAGIGRAGDGDRGHEHDDEGVGVGAVERFLDGLGELLGGGLGADVDGLVREVEVLGEQGVGGEQADGGGVADDGDALALGQRLVGEQERGVEQLGQRVDPDHAGLLEQRLHARLIDFGGGGGETGDDGVSAGLDRDDGLGAAESPGEPGELARVAERLQVEQHDVGGGVGLPVLQQVVAGDVGAVARRDERGQAQAPSGGVGEDGRAEGAGLAEEARAASCRQLRGEARVEPDLGVEVEDTERVRADHAHAVRSRLGREPAFG